jgi:DNA polymerase-1
MTAWVFDIETDGLLHQCTRMWILAAYNLNTHELKYWLEGDLSWQEEFNKADLLVGHNIIDFDISALKKLFNYTLPKSCTIHDTMLISQIMNFKRFGNDGHSLERWGLYLGQPKQEHEDWSEYSEAMKTRCISDVELNVKIYKVLEKEIKSLALKAPQIIHYLRAEHAVATWSARAKEHGWPFDIDSAIQLEKQLSEEMQKTYDELSSKLGIKAVIVDKYKGQAVPKKPKWTKAGFYDAHTSNWFDIDPCSGFEGEERPVLGEYCRVLFEPLSLGSVSDVKIFLYRNGWKPTEWNYKRDENGKKIKSSPKISDDSLEFLGGDGVLYKNFSIARSRHSILKTWLENLDDNNNLHGDCFVIGTPSMRTRHSIIVNVPKASSPWGKEMRSLFICKPGWKLIGADSSGNQARGLAHYINSEEYTHKLLNEDIHTYNAQILHKIALELDEIWIPDREASKRVLYAFLFGAAGPKLWSYMFGHFDEDKGKKLKKRFVKSVPGFEDLVDKLENIYSKTKQYGEGYIPGIAGNKIYCDSYHKLLVYLLQACEKATCAASLMLTMAKLEEENIPYIPLIFYHDEIQWMVPEQYAERACQIGEMSFREGPKLFGIQIMDGKAQAGNNWFETH